MSSNRFIADAFDIFNRTRLQSRVLEDIWQQAYGQDYASNAKPDAFYPLSVLNRIVTAAEAQASNHVLLDIGCGHGLTGLFLAQRLESKLFGIDISPASIALARSKALDSTVSNAAFWVADAASTKLDDCVCSVVTCLDVLLYLPDKLAVMREIHRVLQPGGIFAFTTWEQKGFNQRLGALQVGNYRPLLVEVGFDVEDYDEVSEAREQQRRVFEGLIAREDDLRQELGAEPASMFVKMGKSASDEADQRRYVFGIARKKES